MSARSQQQDGEPDDSPRDEMRFSTQQQDEQQEDTGTRVRTLTEKGMEQYKEKVDYYFRKLGRAAAELDKLLKDEIPDSDNEARRLKKDIELSKELYNDIYKEYMNMLVRYNTQESAIEQSKQSSAMLYLVEAVKEKLKVIESRKPRSAKSQSSNGSRGSRKALSLQKAKASTAETRVRFTVMEAELRKKMAVLNAELEVVAAEKEAAVATAAYQNMVEECGDEGSRKSNSVYSDTVLKKFFGEYDQQEIPAIRTDLTNQTEQEKNQHQTVQVPLTRENVKKEFGPKTPAATPGIPVYPHQTVQSTIGVSDLSNYLIKREFLIHNGIESFNDKAEGYQSWKDSFCALKAELKPNAREELDLLLKYLGPESKKSASSIKCANSRDPGEAVKKVWSRLEDRYGSPVLVETALRARIEKFADISYKDQKRLFDLADLLGEIQARMTDPIHQRSLSFFDSSSGMRPIIAKLPGNLQEKWTSRASAYKAKYQVLYPPFSALVGFVNDMSKIRNDPGFQYNSREPKNTSHTTPTATARKEFIRVKKTAVDPAEDKSDQSQCMLHEANHGLNECKTFQRLTLNERKKLLKDYKFCFRCCSSTAHNFKTCQNVIKCATCGRDNHCTALHLDKSNISKTPVQYAMKHGGEKPIVTSCTAVCGEFSGRSCAKTVLVNVYPVGRPDLCMKTYALLDDQSNSTLARAEFFDRMSVPWSSATSYSLTSCAGQRLMTGRRAGNFVVESVDGMAFLELPVVTECSDIPDERAEIPTPEITQFHSHLQDVVIPPLDTDAPILLLIGRDLPEAHHVYDQRTGPRGAPFAQKTVLGWVLIGNVCLDGAHPPNNLQVMKTTVGQGGRGSLLEDCESFLTVKVDDGHLFRREPNDNMVGPSVEDKKFLDLMDKEFTKDPCGNWIAPLPFREPRTPLPNNRSVALKRASMLQASLYKNPVKQEHFLTFMQRIFDCGHAEPAPPLIDDTECWYLPIFGVYHPKKKDKIRVVFDSSSKHEGVSLNSTLMQGPDLLNRLDGVLLRFREEAVAIIADIQQMFFGFLVTEPHRNYLRFFWHRENDPTKSLAEYRMRVHVFGNAPSPAVANYGLRRCVDDETCPCEDEVKTFVKRNFYVDDGLASFPSVEKAVSVLKKTQQVLLQ